MLMGLSQTQRPPQGPRGRKKMRRSQDLIPKTLGGFWTFFHCSPGKHPHKLILNMQIVLKIMRLPIRKTPSETVLPAYRERMFP